MEIKVPDLGDGIDSGDVLNVLVQEGDTVAVEQGIVELETDKAVAEIPCPHAGRVTKIHVAAGETIAVGATLISLELTEAGAGPKTAEPSAVTPARGEEVISEPELRPAPTPAEPTPVAAPRPVEVAPPTPAPITARSTAAAPAGPTVRRFAREVGIDIHTVAGTAAGGRITRDDVLAAVRAAGQATVTASTTAEAAAPDTPGVDVPGQPSNDNFGPIHVDRVSKIRATIAKNMVQSKSTAPHVTNFDDADVTELEQIRQSSKADYAASGIKLTTMPFVLKAVAQALRNHPVINASIDLEAGDIIYKRYVNVGVAVDTVRGLMVPVIPGADTLSIPQLARALTDLATKARTNKITIDEMRGGTFTISNLGSVGGTYSTPVINVPEVAILLLGRSREVPVVVDGEIEPRLMMPLSISYDHRLVDGAAAARFLNEVKSYLEAPGRLLIAP
jgi:pyruvate/2-oxoglutarate dehydrogenase complex dihydrolipoamide acyltransferase (E2) component